MTKKNKRKYYTPVALKYELVSDPMMLVVSGETAGTNVGSGTAGNGTPDLVNEKRGEWGNLWKRS